MIITIFLVVAVGVGVYVFVKNNPNKVKKIDDSVKTAALRAKMAAAREIEVLKAKTKK